MGRLIEDPTLHNLTDIFEDRTDAGKMLAAELMGYRGTDSIVLAIPSGGVPVGLEIAETVDLQMDLIIVRKLRIPYNPEAGFGAVSPDGRVILNQTLVTQLKLAEEDVKRQVQKTMSVIRKRNELFRGGNALPEIKDKTAIIVDDGLASGYTMLAAVRFAKRMKPRQIAVAVPTCSKKVTEFIVREVDELYCLNVRTGLTFAVADAYTGWYDLDDEEVLALLDNPRYLTKTGERG
jgi:putative phosphoribosyl transferase